MTRMLQCEILTTEAAMEALAKEWAQLQAAAGRIPFTSYEWVQAWWQHIGKPKGRVLHIVAGRAEGRLVAILPLTTQSKKGMRVMQGIGTEALFPFDMLSEKSDYAADLWEAAYQSRAYDFAVIKDVDAGSPCGQALAVFACRRESEKVPYLSLSWSSGAAWVESLPGKVQREYRRCQRRLQEKGEVQYHMATSPPAPAAIIDGMVGQKKTWCREHGLHGFFDQPGVDAFFRQWLETAAASKQLLLGWLQCGGDIVAYNLGFIYKEIFYGYLVTNDPAWASFSPGSLTITNAISWAIDNGCREFNFMQGEGAHKLRYTDDTRDYAEWTFSRSLPGRLKENAFIGLRILQKKIKDFRKKAQHRPAKPAADPAAPQT